MPRNAVAYDDDFFAWTQEQARLLRTGAFSEIDVANTAEELEDMGRSIRRELRNRLTVLIMHLLKWHYQPVFRSPSWSGTIREQRTQVRELLDESPSLRPALRRQLATLYIAAVIKASVETGLAEDTFPSACPYTPDQILKDGFLPD